MSQSYVVRNEIDQVLEIRPFDRKWTWTNSLQHGTPLTASDAAMLASEILRGPIDDARQAHRARVVKDYHNRTPYPLFAGQKVSGL